MQHTKTISSDRSDESMRAPSPQPLPSRPVMRSRFPTAFFLQSVLCLLRHDDVSRSFLPPPPPETSGFVRRRDIMYEVWCVSEWYGAPPQINTPQANPVKVQNSISSQPSISQPSISQLFYHHHHIIILINCNFESIILRAYISIQQQWHRCSARSLAAAAKALPSSIGQLLRDFRWADWWVLKVVMMPNRHRRLQHFTWRMVRSLLVAVLVLMKRLWMER